MRLPKDTLKKIESIQKILKVNRTQATSLSIKIAHTIINKMDTDGTISIARPDGTIEKILFVL